VLPLVSLLVTPELINENMELRVSLHGWELV
jgi:hypothetical protein